MTSELEPQATQVAPALRAQHPPYFAQPERHLRFENPWKHPPLPGFSSVLKWKLESNPLRPAGYRPRLWPATAQAMADFEQLSGSRIFWIGHASFLYEIDGTRVVVDPVFGKAGGIVRRVIPAAARAEELGEVSAVLITHGHHDHLDPGSLKQLARCNKDRVVFVVPKGLAQALPKECRPVVELGWWQFVEVAGLKLHLVPAQHWHQRSLFDKNRGLWGGYVVEGSHRIYHSGDTGYFEGFRAIGQAFPSIDAACLPLGAYEPTWMMSTQHMGPGDSLRAFHDLGATHFVGMHWGTFDLSNEPLDAGAIWLEDTLQETGLERERFHVVRTGGSVALSGAARVTEARSLGLLRDAG